MGALGRAALIVVLAAGAVGAAKGKAPGAPGVSTPPPAPAGDAAPGTDIPANYLALYRQAGSTCPGIDWATLAGVGKIETNHGRSTLPGVHSGTNSAGA